MYNFVKFEIGGKAAKYSVKIYENKIILEITRCQIIFWAQFMFCLTENSDSAEIDGNFHETKTVLNLKSRILKHKSIYSQINLFPQILLNDSAY